MSGRIQYRRVTDSAFRREYRVFCDGATFIGKVRKYDAGDRYWSHHPPHQPGFWTGALEQRGDAAEHLLLIHDTDKQREAARGE